MPIAQAPSPPNKIVKRGNLLKAALYVNFGVLLFSLMGVFIKLLAQHFDSFQIAFARNIGGAAVLILFLLQAYGWRIRPPDLVIRQWVLGLGRGLSVSIAQVAFFFALTKMELATVQTIAYATPLFVTVMSIFVLHDRVGVWRWSAVILGFVGVMLVMGLVRVELDPLGLVFGDIGPLGWIVFLPLGAAALYGTNLVTMRLFDSEVPTVLINNYTSVWSVLFSAGIVLLFSTSGWQAPLEAWAMLLGMSLAGGVGVYCISTGYREVAPSAVAPFDYFGLVYALLFGWMFFSEWPWDRLFPGVALIIGAGLLILWRQRVKQGS